jgi:hypothetical protein
MKRITNDTSILEPDKLFVETKQAMVVTRRADVADAREHIPLRSL